MKDPTKDPDPVGWHKDENQRIRIRSCPMKMFRFFCRFRHSFTEDPDPDPIDVDNSVQGSGSGQPGADRQGQGSGSGSDRKSTGFGTMVDYSAGYVLGI